MKNELPTSRLSKVIVLHYIHTAYIHTLPKLYTTPLRGGSIIGIRIFAILMFVMSGSVADFYRLYHCRL